MHDERLELFGRYLALLDAARPQIALLFVVGVGAGLALRARAGKPPVASAERLPRLVLAASIAAGLLLAWGQRSLVDDAFISFRYARNWLEGQGLVWNAGERVEGYTNFLWTVGIALITKVTGVAPPRVGLFLPLACFVANVAVITRIGRALAGGETPYVPWAAALFAVNYVATQFATTGMETMAASLLVDAALLVLVTRTGPRAAALAGSLLVLATLTRPDHGLFYAAGGLVVAADAARALLAARRGGDSGPKGPGIRSLAAYALPLAPYAGYLAWKLSYYGAILPNTFHAKSAGAAYWVQGATYAATFLAGAHFWVVVPLFLAGLAARRADPAFRRFALFAAFAFVLWNGYVLRVGGDFMYGRFYVALTPMLLLGAEAAVARQLAVGRDAGVPRRAAGPVALGMLLATAVGLPLIPREEIRCGVADEASFYPVESLRPLRIGHPGFLDGQAYAARLTRRGITPTIATDNIGMIGYFSRLRVVDIHGLTDPEVARASVARRGRPGHEKTARVEHLWRAGVDFISIPYHPGPYAPIMEFELGVEGKQWYVFRYHRDLMRRIAAVAPEIRFTDFERYLDGYLAGLPRKDRATVRRDYDAFRAYYFASNPDPERARRFEEYLAGPIPAPAAGR